MRASIGCWVIWKRWRRENERAAMSELRVSGPARALSGEATVPGDKSIGHRAVMLAGICDGRVMVRGLSGGEDNRRTVAALAALGVVVRQIAAGALEIEGAGVNGLRAAAGELDCGNSGTSIRLLMGLLGPRAFTTRLTGDVYLRARPMRRVADPLRQMGALVEGAAGKKPGELYPPVAVGGGTSLHGIRWESKVSSAQVKSAILLGALGAEGATTVVEPSRSRDHTERMLRALGAPIRVEGNAVTLDPSGWSRRLSAGELVVPGDLSSAAFVLAAATLVPGSRVTVRGVGVNPTRTGFLDALRLMGGDVTVENPREEGGEPVADLTARAASLGGVEISGELAVRAIDELPLLAALAAHADGATTIRDAAELRVKESDRVASTVAMLRALGAEAEEREDGLQVGGRARSPGVIDSHGDHRIAMAGAVCALPLRGETRLLDTDNVATSFPGFAALLASLGAEIG
jgi:3-phosphoshikimate 1-carboxyvinyltransferase